MAQRQDDHLLDRLRARDEQAFCELVHHYHSLMLAFAKTFTANKNIAEEAIQDTWAIVVEGLPRFEGRSSLKTWIYSILANRLRSLTVREARARPFADFSAADGQPMDADKFAADGHWLNPVQAWEQMTPERLVSDRQLAALVHEAIEKLPENQRAVLLLRDVEGEDGPAVATILGISEANQRVLLHRARQSVRQSLSLVMVKVEKHD